MFPVPASEQLRNAKAHGQGETAASYLLSSLELRAGLDVCAIPPGALPLDVLHELLRLHACWNPARPRSN